MRISTLLRIGRLFVMPFLFLIITQTLTAQYTETPKGIVPYPKREFRAVWMASVVNIDYPAQPTTWRIPLREEYKNMLDRFRKWGFNAVVVQIRPASDAMYPSEFAPWSEYLTGQQGQAPEKDYDPLKFMVEEAHKRGLEFHAWMNPYRATVDLDTLSLAQNHVFNQHRDWVIRYGNRFYLNPGLSAVRNHLTDIVGEVVENYDIDAIHFDDYFYPYKIKGQKFPDSLDHIIYGGRLFTSIEDWRRNNVDLLIEQLSTRIKKIKPHVRFGISPFGVWRNKSQDPLGSDTRAGATSYDDLYADVLKWMREGWIDYIVPQIYWNIGFPPADFATLVEWWSRNTPDQHLYIGLGAYKVGVNQEPAWHDPQEIPRQIDLLRRNWRTQGGIFFSARSLINNRLGVKDSLYHIYKYPALIPEIDGISGKTPHAPDLKRAKIKKGAVHLKWRSSRVDNNNPPSYYVVYRFEGERIGNFDDPANIIGMSAWNEEGRKKFCFNDFSARPGVTYTYVVKALNRQHKESEGSNAIRIRKGMR